MTRSQHNEHEERRSRAMTDDDVQALADEIEGRIVARFYGNIGKGIWGLVWRAILGGLVVIAAYGAAKGIKP